MKRNMKKKLREDRRELIVLATYGQRENINAQKHEKEIEEKDRRELITVAICIWLKIKQYSENMKKKQKRKVEENSSLLPYMVKDKTVFSETC